MVEFATRYKRVFPEIPKDDSFIPKDLNDGLSVSGNLDMTMQCFKDECDITTIMARYHKTGFMYDPSIVPTRTPFDGDFSELPSFQEVQNTYARTNEFFASLSARVRERFGNNPSALVAFMQDDANRAEAVKLGLISSSLGSPIEEISPPLGGNPGGENSVAHS